MPEDGKLAGAADFNAGFIAWGLYGVLIIIGSCDGTVCVGSWSC